MLHALVGRSGVARCSVRKRAVKVIFGFFDLAGCARDERLCLRRSLHGRGIVAREIAHVYLADPIPALMSSQGRMAGQKALELEFVKLSAIKGAEFGRQPAERSNQCKHRKHDKTTAKLRLLGKGQAKFGFTLHVAQRVARNEKV